MPVRNSRNVTITNHADALPLQLIIDDFLHSHEFAPANTQRTYRNSLSEFSAFLCESLSAKSEHLMFYDLTQSSVEAFRDTRLLEKAPTTVRLWVSTVKALSKFASHKYHNEDRAGMVRTGKFQRPTFKALHEGQYAALQDVIAAASIRDRFIGDLLTMTGIRNGEACRLRCLDISPDWRSLHVVHGKSIDPRIVPLPKALRRSLISYLDWRMVANYAAELPLLVSSPTRMGRNPAVYQMSEKTVWRVMNRMMSAAGIPASLAHPHTLRHTFARRTLPLLTQRLGTLSRALKAVQELLGHRSIETTQIYLTEDQDEILDSLADFT